jgi:hypothetical protein
LISPPLFCLGSLLVNRVVQPRHAQSQPNQHTSIFYNILSGTYSTITSGCACGPWDSLVLKTPWICTTNLVLWLRAITVAMSKQTTNGKDKTKQKEGKGGPPSQRTSKNRGKWSEHGQSSSVSAPRATVPTRRLTLPQLAGKSTNTTRCRSV